MTEIVNHQSKAKLTKFIRLTIFSFLDLKTTVLKVAKLSIEERTNLQDSKIAQENKNFALTINNTRRPACLLHYGGISSFLRQFQMPLAIAETVTITFETLNCCNQHDLGEEIGLLLCRLPQRLDYKKLSICTKQQTHYKSFVDSMINVVERARPELIFREFEMQAC